MMSANKNPDVSEKCVLRSSTSTLAGCAELPKRLRAIGFRDLERHLFCLLGFGSDAWDRLFAEPRPAELQPRARLKQTGCRHGNHRMTEPSTDVAIGDISGAD